MQINKRKPKMIIFDYGHTLLYEPGHNTTNGNRAIYEYINNNPKNITLDEFDKIINDLFEKIKGMRGELLEIHEHRFLEMAYEYMGIEMSVSLEKAEQIIWNGISEGKVMPYVTEMLNYLKKVGIRTGVISNICFSGKALEERLNRLLPDNNLEFVLASSDCVIKKPDSHMFKMAMVKSGLNADDIWYCGDTIGCDVYGAHNAGIFPVLYSGNTPDDPNPFDDREQEKNIDFEYLHIYDWRELIEILQQCPD